MKHVHRLRTELTPSDCRALFEAAEQLDLRVGWLDLDSVVAAVPQLEEAAAQGAFRSVALASGRVFALKRVRGASVLKDLLREHFSGCRLVLVRGEVEAAELLGGQEGYRIRFEDGSERTYSAEALAKALRKPRLRRVDSSQPDAPGAS